MKRAEREAWLVAHVLAVPGGADVCNRDFVDAYIEATGAAYRGTHYGAYKCRMLGSDLARLVKQRRLSRSRTGIQGMAGMGFPRWVWLYRKPKLTGWEPELIARDAALQLDAGASSPSEASAGKLPLDEPNLPYPLTETPRSTGKGGGS